jgi:hypothetical protein
MKHHFGDFLDREGEYWTVVPNRERFAYEFRRGKERDQKARIALIGKDTPGWRKCLELPNLEELTLHEGSVEQFGAICGLAQLKRLRITHLRPRDIEAIAGLANLEELVLEYVSGFSDLSPLSRLPRLRALHLENLRRVSDFSGLAGSKSLRLLDIYGTLDWNQPIDDFEFLGGLPNLEVFDVAFVTSKRVYPAFLPAAPLRKIKKLKIPPTYFDVREYALLSVMFPTAEGADWGGWRQLGDWIDFTGKRAGRVTRNHADVPAKCAEADRRFEALRAEARALLANAKARA